MGKKSDPRVKTFVIVAIGSVIMGFALARIYVSGSSNHGHALPIVGGIVALVVGGGSSLLSHKPYIILTLLGIGMLGLGAIAGGFTA
jgi:hypothetical protein